MSTLATVFWLASGISTMFNGKLCFEHNQSEASTSDLRVTHNLKIRVSTMAL